MEPRGFLFGTSLALLLSCMLSQQPVPTPEPPEAWVDYGSLKEIPALAPGKSSYPAYRGSDPARVQSLYYAPLWTWDASARRYKQVTTAPWSYEHVPGFEKRHGHDNNKLFRWHWDMQLHPQIWMRLAARYRNDGVKDILVAQESYTEFVHLVSQDRELRMLHRALGQLNKVLLCSYEEIQKDGSVVTRGLLEFGHNKVEVNGVYFGPTWEVSKYITRDGKAPRLLVSAEGKTYEIQLKEVPD